MSRNLAAEAEICIRALNALHIPLGQIREIRIDKRSIRRWGVCRKDPDGSFRIGISAHLLQEDVPLQRLRETLFHELLHTAPDCMKHTGNWKQYAQLVNRELNLNISRTVSGPDAPIPKGRTCYRFICLGCGAEQIRYRRCSLVLHPERYRCGKCGGRFLRTL